VGYPAWWISGRQLMSVTRIGNGDVDLEWRPHVPLHLFLVFLGPRAGGRKHILMLWVSCSVAVE
jgi:hypothetical protein